MKNNSKATADQEAICQALEQLQDSMEIIQQIISRLRRSVNQAQVNLTTDLPAADSQPDNKNLEAHLRHVGNRRQRDKMAGAKEERYLDDLPKVLH